MKLLHIKIISSFRSLPKNFEVHFLRKQDHARCFEFHPYCLAGLNGSGKSNLLEVIATIFYHVECTYLNYRPEGFGSEDEDNLDAPGFNSRLCTPDAFELEYLFPTPELTPITGKSQFSLHRVAHIQITKDVGVRPIIRWLNRSDFEPEAKPELARDKIKDLLPRYILGYSSGHNETLSLPFFKMRFIHFDEYRDKLIKKVDYPNRPEGRLIYLDEQFSQVILLCHYLFPSDAVTEVFKKKIHLNGFRCFRIIIRRFHKIPLKDDPLGRLESDEFTLNLEKVIDKLIRCSTSYHKVFTPKFGKDAHDLYLDFWVDESTRAAFQFHFKDESGGTVEQQKAASALSLFHAFQALLTFNYYMVDDQTKTELYESLSLYVNETVPTPASHERVVRFKDTRLLKKGVQEKIYLKNLSDGEHQLLHTIGLCLLFRHVPVLFLLDEPETHLNPEWRASYISTLRAALEADKSNSRVMREVLLTSHSPFIISDCRKENVLVFTKNPQTQKVTCKRPDFETFGASATLLTNEIFDRPETIGDFANDELKRIESLAAQDNPDRLDIARQLDRTLGDSIEKTLAIGRILRGSKKP